MRQHIHWWLWKQKLSQFGRWLVEKIALLIPLALLCMLIGIIIFAYLGRFTITEAVSITEAILTAFLVIATITYTMASIRMQWTNRDLVKEARRDREYESVKRLIVFGIDPLISEIDSHRSDTDSLDMSLPPDEDGGFVANSIKWLTERIFDEEANIQPVVYPEIQEWDGPESDDVFTDIEDFCWRYRNEAHVERNFGNRLQRYRDNWEDYREQRDRWIGILSRRIPGILSREVKNKWMREMISENVAHDLSQSLVTGDALSDEESEELLSKYGSVLKKQSSDSSLTYKARMITENRLDIYWSLRNLRSHCKQKYGIFEKDLNAIKED